MSKIKKVKWFVIGAILCVIAVLLYYSSTRGVAIETFEVSKGEITQYIEEIATVRSRDSQVIYFEGQGKVTDLKVDVGDTVYRGQLLASLDKKDVRIQLRDADAQVAAARAQFEGLEITNHENKIRAAELAVEQANIAFQQALENFKNAKELYDIGALSKSELDSTEVQYKTAEALLHSAMLEYEEVKNGVSEQVRQTYKARLDQAIAYRDILASNAQKQDLYAPADGVIIDKQVDANCVVAPGTPAFVIGSTQDLVLEANILADDAIKIEIGQAVEISGRTIGDTVLKGRVSKIAPAAKSMISSLGVNQKRVPITIELTEGIGFLKPGFSVDIKIITANNTDVVSVPDSCVFKYNGNDCVFVVKDGKTQIRNVSKGMQSDKFSEITKGLEENELIILRPDNNLKEGTKINAID